MTSEASFVDDGRRRLVLKRCRDPIYIEWLQREHRALVALTSVPLPIPRVVSYHEINDNDRIVDAWLLTTRLPGVSLWKVLLECPPPERSRHFRRLGALLRTLH